MLGFGEVRKHPNAGGSQTRHLHTGDSLIEVVEMSQGTYLRVALRGNISRSLGCREQSGLKDWKNCCVLVGLEMASDQTKDS